MSRTVPRWRLIVAWVCLVVSCVLTPFAVVAVWAHSELLDTDRYVQTVAPLARNPDIQQAVATRVTDLLFEHVDVQQLAEEALPERAAFLAAPLAAALRDFVGDVVLRVLESDQFQTVWDEANRRAHAQVERALTGGGPIISTRNGRVELDLSGIVARVRTELSSRGIGFFDELPIGTLALRFTLFDAESLRKAQDAIDLLDTLRVVLPIVVVVLGVAAVLLAADHRRAVFRWGIGIVVATLVLGFAISMSRDLYLDALPESASRAANTAAFNIVVRFLRNTNRIVFLVGLLLALGAYLTGSGRLPVYLRSKTGGALRGAADHVDVGEAGPIAGLARVVAQHGNAFRIGGVLVAFLILVALDYPDATTVLWLALALLVYLALVVVVERIGRNEAARLAGEGSEP